SNCNCVEPERDETGHVWNRIAAKCTPDEIGLLTIGIGDADQLNGGKFCEDARMVAAHDADPYHPHAQHSLRAVVRAFHCPACPLANNIRSDLAWQTAVGDLIVTQSKHVLSQRVTFTVK